jgi:hypothetical protein
MDLSKLRKDIPKTASSERKLSIIKLVKRREGMNNGIEEYDIEEGDMIRPLRWTRPSIYGHPSNPIND